MTLTHQFLITLTLPALFVALSIYTWRQCRSRLYGPYWSLTMFVAALWASSLLSYYVGVTLPAETALSWRVAVGHVFTAFAFLCLLTTTAFLHTPRRHRRLLLGISALFWLLAFLVDPAIWPYRFLTWSDNGQDVTHFHLWSALWVTAWLLPFVAGMMLTRDAMGAALSTLYRNRLSYWFTTLFLSALSGMLALVQQPGQPAWQELGGLGILLASVLGMRTLVRSNLTNLRLAFRHGLARLAATALILALTWLLLFFIVDSMSTLSRNPTILELGLAAVIFTALFGAVNRYVPYFIRRLLLGEEPVGGGALVDEPALATALPDPAALGGILLRLIQFNIATASARLLLVSAPDEPEVRLYQIAGVGEVEGQEAVEIAATSALLGHLRQRPPAPLSTYDLETLPTFADIGEEEKSRLRRSSIEVLMPLCAGHELVGLLALGEKFSGESYDQSELLWLQNFGAHAGLLLWQAKELQHNINQLEAARASMQGLEHEAGRLHELLQLHDRFAELISPALREPFEEIHHTLDVIRKENKASGSRAAVGDLNRQLAQLRLTIDNLIIYAARIQQQHELLYTNVDLSEIVGKAVHDLQTMSSARRVSVNIVADGEAPHVRGDWQRLYEAVQHLVHNAIRFNRIGGCVDVAFGVSGQTVYLDVRDDGVGISGERLAQMWEGPAPEEAEQPGSSGLGLALTRFIIRAHGGELNVESTPGLGTTFSITLPLCQTETAAATL